MKKQEIKNLLVQYFKEKKVYESVNQIDLENLADELSKMNFINADILLKYIGKVTVIIKESVDFSDTNYLITQMVNLINSK
jgi:hypothetical protein